MFLMVFYCFDCYNRYIKIIFFRKNIFEGVSMNIIIHLPTKEINLIELKKVVSNIHSEKIINYIGNLNLSNPDKEKLINLIVQ